jgi:hypothetical protein
MTTLTPIPEYDAPASDDSAGQFGPDAEELSMFPELDAPAAAAPEPAKTGKPGPKPNPNSARQRKLAAAAQRARTAPGPAKKSKPNTPAKPPSTPTEAYQAGAMHVIGFATRGLAMAGFATGLATQNPKLPPARRAKMAQHATALTLDSFTIALHAEPLAEGLAALAPDVGWLARGLENAAKVGPYAKLGEAAVAIVLQVLTNHGFLPPLPDVLGTLSAEDLADAAGVPLDGPPAE